MAGSTARVQLHAISGLASTHTAPFVRLLHDDVIAYRHRATERPRQSIVAMELPEDQELPAMLKRSHHVRSEFTAHWDPDQPCIANLPGQVDWIEVQVWNRFADVAVFLGVTKISLRESRRSISEPIGDQDTGKPASSGRTMWYPLDPGRDLVGSSRRTFSLSVQLSLSWRVLNERAMRIHEQIKERREGRQRPGVDTEGEVVSSAMIADPSFQFTEPSTAIEWSVIVAANIRRIFLRGDIDELQLFHDDVLHGDMEQEIEEDDTIYVDEGHLKAFRLCQLSAQYLDHCVTLLDSRKDEYSDLYRTLKATSRDRRRDRKQLMDHKHRLQKELGELDMLLSKYEKLLEHHGKGLHPIDPSQCSEIQTSTFPSHVSPDLRDRMASPARDIAGVVSKKPAFLMTWEEREQARKEQKELDKARRIEDEKMRLQRLFQERQDRESLELRICTLGQRRRDRNARLLQAKIRSFVIRRRLQRVSTSNLAARKIQTQARRYMCLKKWPQHRIQLREAREQRRMSSCDRESAEMRRQERDAMQQQTELIHSRDPVIVSDDNDSIGSPNAKPIEALELVAMWKKLKRILTLACEKGARPTVVFSKLDSRGDGVVDRAELRMGVRHFGIRMDRRMTRAIISLVRAKCGDPPRPLTLTVAQFIQGFELPVVAVTHVSESTSPDKKKSRGIEAADLSSSKGREDRVHQRESHELDNVEDAADHKTSQKIEEVAEAVSNLRRRVLQTAQDHLAANHKSTTDYFAFRAALTHVFEEFDVDGNGELDLHELVDCMAAINFRVTPENLAIVRECFVTDPTSESVSITEFISFALAGLHTSTTSGKPADEELGILGYKLRDAILGRVKNARKQTDSIEDAVRLVFKGAYSSNTKYSCPRKDFARVLASLRLGFTPAQLSRLVLRLDQDGDNTVSFDEVLTWLRLRGGSEISPTRAPQVTSNSREKRSGTADFIRAIFTELAGASDMTMSHKSRTQNMASLFQQIDRNGSKKINATELEEFLSSSNLADLRAVIERDESHGEVKPAQLAKETVKLIDLNGNGVVTLEEWMGFVLGENPLKPGDRSHSERYAIVEGVREMMQSTFANKNALLDWFHSIPGAITIDKSRSSVEMKVRAREFKNAMRGKFPRFEPKDLDEALKVLDADGSGWITEKELCAWQYPTRDMEELIALITRVWAEERQSAKHKDLPDDAFVDVLYQRFDQDGNGVIARKEVREGFRSFRVLLNDEETLLLVTEFDLNHDGFWNRAEFTAFVHKLLRTNSTSRMGVNHQQLQRHTSASQEDDDGYDSPDPDFAEDTEMQGEEKSEEEEDDYSLGEMSPPAMSPIQFDEDTVARSRQQRTIGIEYSEDFDDEE